LIHVEQRFASANPLIQHAWLFNPMITSFQQTSILGNFQGLVEKLSYLVR